jgi:hypothetical protein
MIKSDIGNAKMELEDNATALVDKVNEPSGAPVSSLPGYEQIVPPDQRLTPQEQKDARSGKTSSIDPSTPEEIQAANQRIKAQNAKETAAFEKSFGEPAAPQGVDPFGGQGNATPAPATPAASPAGQGGLHLVPDPGMSQHPASQAMADYNSSHA